MRKLIVRSPGRTPKRGKKQPGILARGVIEFESPEELERSFETLPEQPFWDRQCAEFEAFARRFSNAPKMSASDLTAPEIAGEVLWWAGCLRESLSRSQSGLDIVFVAMNLAGKMVQLTIAANEQALLVGQDQTAPRRFSERAKHEKWRAEAHSIRAAMLRPMSETQIAVRIKKRLGLSESIDWIARKIKPA